MALGYSLKILVLIFLGLCTQDLCELSYVFRDEANQVELRFPEKPSKRKEKYTDAGKVKELFVYRFVSKSGTQYSYSARPISLMKMSLANLRRYADAVGKSLKASKVTVKSNPFDIQNAVQVSFEIKRGLDTYYVEQLIVFRRGTLFTVAFAFERPVERTAARAFLGSFRITSR